MSNFNRTVPSLAALTGLPIFQRMLDTGTALPMAVGIADAARAAAVECVGTEEAKAAVAECVRSSITRLCWSKRYLEAVAAVGSMRHTSDGSPVGLVSDTHRAFAVEQLARPVSERRPQSRIFHKKRKGGAPQAEQAA
jgi:sRNA-binding protein